MRAIGDKAGREIRFFVRKRNITKMVRMWAIFLQRIGNISTYHVSHPFLGKINKESTQ